MTSLPLHPLLVHIPVVLIPLVLLLAIPAILSRRWFQWTAPFTLALSFIALVGGFLATATGESLEERLGEHSALLEQHAQLGELTRTLAALVFVLVLAQTLLFWHRAPEAGRRWGRRLPALYLVLALLTTAAGAATTVAAVEAGHAGAQLVWQGEGADAGSGAGSDAPASTGAVDHD